MLVDFVVRSDVDSKSGGDTHQIEQYARHLSDLGCETTIQPMSPSLRLRQSAVVHLANTARPYELLDAFDQARGHPVVVSPIHHSLSLIRRMRRSESGQGLRTVVGRYAPEAVRELAASSLRSRPSADRALARRVAEVPTLWRTLGRMLDRVSLVAVLAHSERTTLMADTGWSGRNHVVVPNGRPSVPSGRLLPWPERDPALLVVGRVEPRKRPLEVARIAAEAGIPVTFVGEPNTSTAAYVESFRRVVESAPRLEWLGSLPHDAVLARMARHRVLLNASWVEVQSLVDIEAASAGCTVFGTLTGSTHEYFPGRSYQFSGDDLRPLVHAAHRFARREQPPAPGPASTEYPHTWESAALLLRDAYRSIVPDPVPL